MLRRKQSKRLLGHEQLDPRVMMSADGLPDALVLTGAQTNGEPLESLEVRIDQVLIEVDVDRIEIDDIDIDDLIEDIEDIDLEIDRPEFLMPQFQAGDANRDYVFDRLDIIQVLQEGKYLTGEPADFFEGDFTGDGVFDPRDIVAALQTGNYGKGPYVEAVEDGSTIDELLEAIESITESSEISDESRHTKRYSFDGDKDGVVDAELLDPDRDGDADFIHINDGDNKNAKGKPDFDSRLVDTDGDGFYDLMWTDADGDRKDDPDEFRRLVPPIPVVRMPK